MKDKNTYLNRKIEDSDFDLNVDIFLKNDIKQGQSFKMHWHEHLQIYYFVEGWAVLECGRNRFNVSPGNVAIANSNELHYLESLSDDIKFYTIRIAPSFLLSNHVDSLQTKYLSPIALNQIAFQNLIENDEQILISVTNVLKEYYSKDIGYELAIKASIYQLIVQLFRRYVTKILTKNEFEERTRTLIRLENVFQIIENNYSDKISLKELAASANISPCQFCRTFKLITGKTTTDYINGVRIEKAVCFLEQTNLNITEIAMKCGFDSVNYFSRLFKKRYNISATKFRKALTE